MIETSLPVGVGYYAFFPMVEITWVPAPLVGYSEKRIIVDRFFGYNLYELNF